MLDLAKHCEDMVAELASDPALGRFLRPDTTALVWSLDGARLLWRSAGARLHAPRLDDPDEEVPQGPLRERLRALGGGEAPPAGFRLVPLEVREQGPAARFACRRVPLGDTEALLTIHLPDEEEEAATASRTGGGEALSGLRARPSARFTWRTDPEGVLREVSPELAEMLGREAAAILGLSWSDAVGGAPETGGSAIDDALSARAAFSGRTVLWPSSDAPALVPVDVGGLPVRDGARGFAGFRGFGVGRPADAVPHPGGSRRRLPPAGRADAPDAAVAPAPAPAPDALPPAGAPADPADGAAAFAPTSRGPDQPGLTSHERGALHEIARVLGARLEEHAAEASGPAPPAGPSAEIVYMPPPGRGRDTELARILDRLPLATAILRDGLPVYANRELLDLAGASDLPDLVARGGWPSLVGQGDVPGAEDGRIEIRLPGAGSRPPRPAALTLLPVVWGESPARLAALRLLAETDADALAAARAEAAGSARRAAGLEGARSRLAEALRVAADGFVTLDAQGRILAMDPGAEALFGRAETELVGDTFPALIAPEDHPAALDELAAAAARPGGRTGEREIQGRRPEGGGVPLLMRVGRTAAEEGVRYVVVFRDGLLARTVERKLREARFAAEQASANQAGFLARISHEIRTPLNAILGFADLMIEERFGPVGNERYQGYLRDIHASGGHVLSLVNDLLDLAKATSGRSDLAPESFDLNLLTRQAVDLTGPIAAQERAILRTSLLPALPPVFADPRSVRQVVLNLLSNAIRFTGAGGQVIVSTAVNDLGQAVLRVRDTGPGLTPDQVEAALTPFRQLPSTRRGDGTGLGLPLSKALVEANGGAFSIGSAPGAGTLVEVRLPTLPAAGLASAAE